MKSIFNYFTVLKQFKQINSQILTKSNWKRSLSSVGRGHNDKSDALKDKTLLDYLRQKIQIKGPLTVADYMKEALGNPIWGYYMKKDVFGSQGDFITSPEISQMFGELIGVWFLNEWQILKNIYVGDLPKTVQLVELGPGRATLMNDLLNVWKKTEAASDLHVYMIESSPFMRRMQLKTLCDVDDQEPVTLNEYTSKHSPSIKIVWLHDLNELPKLEAPQFFLANEFFDALPCHKFQKTEKGHREILVDCNQSGDNFEFKISKAETVASKFYLKLYPGCEKSEHIELSVDAARIIESISRRLSETNGSMLLIDYGHNGDCKDTLRAFRSHKLVENVFQTPGECDITTDVDFAFLKHVAETSKVTCYGPTSQANFLQQMQIAARFKMLFDKSGSDEERSNLTRGLKMLTDSNQMGERFKMMAIRKFDLNQAPPGFIKEESS